MYITKAYKGKRNIFNQNWPMDFDKPEYKKITTSFTVHTAQTFLKRACADSGQ